MQKILIALALAVLTAGPLAASEKTDVIATLNKMVDAFNKSDRESLVAACTDEMSIIDEFSPYEWHGAGTCSKWLTDYNADAKKNEITDATVTIGEAPQVDVNGDRAYVVALANYSYKEKGKPMQETGANWTFTLQKVEAGWRVTGWAWAKH